MKTKIVFLILIFAGLVTCRSQDIKSAKQDEKKGPIEDIRVNRKYDENGNLIQFDSTYTSYYSNFAGDTLMVDSLMKDFHTFFNQHFSGLHYSPFMNRDSDMIQGFFHDDYFEQQFIRQNEELMHMMQRMDSIKNEFFKLHAQEDDLSPL